MGADTGPLRIKFNPGPAGTEVRLGDTLVRNVVDVTVEHKRDSYPVARLTILGDELLVDEEVSIGDYALTKLCPGCRIEWDSRIITSARSDDVEVLSEALHSIYQTEAKRQAETVGDKEHHPDSYADLPEHTKEYDRVLARYILAREARLRRELSG